MSLTQRRNSQRLANTLDALSADLDFKVTDVETQQNENMTPMTPQEYWGNQFDEQESIQLLGQNQEKTPEQPNPTEGMPKEEDQLDKITTQEFDAAFKAAMQEQSGDGDDSVQKNGTLLEGDPGVDEVGSQSTFDTDNVRSLGSDYGIDFDNDQDLQDSIRNVPGRAQKQARIKKLIARIEKVADEFEATGRKSLAYRLDIVCNNLQSKYLK